MSINNTLPCCEEEKLSKSTGPGAGGDGGWQELPVEPCQNIHARAKPLGK